MNDGCGPKPRPLLERFMAKVCKAKRDGDCWLWLGKGRQAGYGVLGAGPGIRKNIKAHRASFMLFKGPIPEGMMVRHTCDTPLCVNPAHLLLGTQADNMRDAAERNRVQRGVDRPLARLTDETAREARRLRAAGESCNSIAAKMGVTHMTISRVTRGLSWVHVT